MRTLLVVLPVFALLGCGSDSTSTPTSEDTGTATDTGTVDEAGADAPLTAPATPQMVSVIKMAGNLHVTWKNNDTGLSKIELYRKKDAGEYAVAYTYTKLATSQHDIGAVAPGTFCYKVKTTRGDLSSELSNEMCGAP